MGLPSEMKIEPDRRLMLILVDIILFLIISTVAGFHACTHCGKEAVLQDIQSYNMSKGLS